MTRGNMLQILNKSLRFVAIILVVYTIPLPSYAQALRGTTGLLHAPTAEMENDKTFKFGANLLALTPLHFYSFNREINKTYNYYINITMFPWLEVGYTCTLNYAVHGSTYFPPQAWGKYTNQDRSFYARFRLWKEGWWQSWTPQVVLGLDDPTSHTSYGGGDITIGDGEMADNHFTRYYLAFTKHFDFNGIGQLGAHVAWVMNYGMGSYSNYGQKINPERFNRPSVGFNFDVNFGEGKDGLGYKLLNGFNLMAEYDARTINVGGEYSIPIAKMKNGSEAFSVHVLGELNDGKYFSGGVQCKVHLK